MNDKLKRGDSVTISQPVPLEFVGHIYLLDGLELISKTPIRFTVKNDNDILSNLDPIVLEAVPKSPIVGK